MCQLKVTILTWENTSKQIFELSNHDRAFSINDVISTKIYHVVQSIQSYVAYDMGGYIASPDGIYYPFIRKYNLTDNSDIYILGISTFTSVGQNTFDMSADEGNIFFMLEGDAPNIISFNTNTGGMDAQVQQDNSYT